VATFTEPQDDNESEVEEVFQQPEQEEPQEQQEPVEQETQAEEEEEDLPGKYKGKTLKDIVRMHQEAEKLIGRQAQEVGEVRKLADELIKRQISTPAPQVTAAKEEDEVDFFEDPRKAVSKAVEKHPAIQQAQMQAAEFKKMQVQTRLQQAFPDFKEVVSDPSFAEWINSSTVRKNLYTIADTQYDFDTAAELISTFKELKATKQVKQTAEVQQATKEQRTKAMKAAAVDTGTVGLDSQKKYRRADLIRLQIEDPDRYQQLQPEIMAAYAEGRVI
jgi:hypothetical protein